MELGIDTQARSKMAGERVGYNLIGHVGMRVVSLVVMVDGQ